jgi:hypothetical protein
MYPLTYINIYFLIAYTSPLNIQMMAGRRQYERLTVIESSSLDDLLIKKKKSSSSDDLKQLE